MIFRPMKAYVGNEDDLKRSDLIFEPKFDGIRALCFVDKNLTFISRNQLDLTQKYPEFDFRKQVNARTCILDGEIIAYDKKGRPSFTLLQQGHEAVFIVFDILMKNDKMLTDLPLIERKKILEDVVSTGDNLEKSVYTKDGPRLWQEIKKYKIEGVMAKKDDSSYELGRRSRAWLKIKVVNTLDCVVIGYSSSKRAVSSLALGLYDKKGKLYYIGNAGTGYSEEMVALLAQKLQKIIIQKTLALNTQDASKDIIWVRPINVAEVKYLEFTAQGMVRHTVFLRLRTDKKAKECTIEDQLPAKEKKLIVKQ